jgi:hypothetical protein
MYVPKKAMLPYTMALFSSGVPDSRFFNRRNIFGANHRLLFAVDSNLGDGEAEGRPGGLGQFLTIGIEVSKNYPSDVRTNGGGDESNSEAGS